MEPAALIVIAGVVFAYALIARLLGKTVLTAPIIFAGAGWLMGPACFNLVEFGIDSPTTHLLVEGALVFLLYTDASRIRFDQLRRGFMLPGRLLLIGLPLTIVLGLVAARLIFPAMTWVELSLLAIMLAPTDAVLGQAVVSSERIPIRIRQALNVESGLNDGIAVPIFTAVFILAGLAAGHASGAAEGGEAEHRGIASYALAQLTLGPLAAILVAWPAGWLVERSFIRKISSDTSVQIAGLAIVIGAVSLATLIGGNVLIAAFVAGLVVGNTTRIACKALLEFSESEGQLLTLIAFLIFGAVMLPLAMDMVTWPVALYAILSLTVVRMLPVFLSTLGSGLRLPTVLFLGWFGPRGLASVLFALMVYEAHGLPGREHVFAIVSFVVAMSILAHGLSAVPLAGVYGRWHERLRAQTPDASECKPAPALPIRFQAPGSIEIEVEAS